MTQQDMAQEALRRGRQQAEEVLDFRAEELQHREQALREAEAAGLGMAADAPALDEAHVAAMGSPPAGVLIAEGDSWFDYPMNNVLRLLEDRHGFDVESVAHNGDRVEDMAYSAGQLEKFTRLLEKLIRRGTAPRAILLSGGGNDVAGTEFAVLLNHAASAAAGLNDTIMRGVIDERIQMAYLHIIASVTRICEERLGRHIPIVIHGYDYPVPDGRGFWGGALVLPGPWLEPGFHVKGYPGRNDAEMERRKDLLRTLIDRFNEMLRRMAAMPDLPHVTYVDLRGKLSSGEDYREWWANELHPTKQGFLLVTEQFAQVIRGV